MLSVDSKVIGIAIEHRNPINQSADFVVWKEGKTRVYRNGEISRGSAVLEGTIHVSTVLESDPMKYLGEICQCSWETHRNKNL